jgi:outer membrane lipoprotein-sorting protein
MKPTDNIKRLIKKLHDTTSAEMDQRVLTDVLHALDESERTLTPKRRCIMKNPITKLAAAAIIITAVLFFIHQFDGQIDGTSAAWAGVIEKLDNIHSYIYREKQSRTSGPQKEGFEFKAQDRENIIFCSEEYGRRTDHFKGEELLFSTYSLRQEQTFTSVLHFAKEYTHHSLPGEEFGGIDPREMVRHILSNDYTELGRDTIDGLTVEGAELVGQKISGPTLDDAVTRLWIDVETGLPVQIELEGFDHGTSTKVHIVWDQFQWNVDLQARDFEPNIPDDYALAEEEIPRLKTEQDELALEKMSTPSTDLPDLSSLTLLNLEKVTPITTTTLSGHIEVWKAQFEIMSEWPAYSDLKQELYEELQTKLDIANLSNEQLMATAIALREKFWDEGGRLSPTSYPYGYAALILLEIAREKNPEGLVIVDELVETIQTIESLLIFNKDTNERTGNMELRMRLKQIRVEQFEQIKQELESERDPTWEDFVRANDLAILCGWTKDFEQGLNVAAWLIDNAEQGGWAAYLQPLENMQNHFNNGSGFNYNIFISTGTSFPEDYRYGGLPSFKGPRKRKATPSHIITPNPFWHGD